MLKVQRWALLGCVVVTAVFVLAGCAAPTPVPVDQTLGMTDSFKFEPATVIAEPGAQVTLHLKNNGVLVHSFYLMEKDYQAEAPFDDTDKEHIIQDIEVPEIQPGATQDVIFTAPTEPGTYEFICGTPGHLEGGMTGTLEVSGP